MDTSGTLRSIISVTFSNIVSIISGILVGFVIPKILSVEGYGYYKTFTLYTTYLSLCHLGIIDGIVLKHGGSDYEHLDRYHFRSVFKWYIIVNFTFTIILSISSIFTRDDHIRFILVLLGLNVVAINVLGYFQQISQITQRFKEFSARKIIQGIINVVLVVILYFAIRFANGKFDYRLYVTLIVIENYILSVWYVITYKDIIFGHASLLTKTRISIIEYIKTGVPLLVANMCATLILTLDRQFVNVLFDVATYGVYSFAYNMLSLVTVATSAISTVLYPTMKRSNEEELLKRYSFLIRIILVFVFAAMTAYFPLVYFVNWYLPKYAEALPIFRIIFAGLPLSSAITVVIHNYYKVYNKNTYYFFKSLIVLLISAMANGIAYYFFRTTSSISVASIVTMLFWYIYTEHYFVKEYKIQYKSNLFYSIVLMITFYSITYFFNDIIGMLVYVAAYSVITIILFKKDIWAMIRLIKR